MAATALVLVVAPDSDFRHSLEFALEAEGFAVVPHARMDGAFLSTGAVEARCAVVDEGAVQNWQEAGNEFRQFGKPVVLLVGRLRPLPDLPFLTVLTKPFLGYPLIEAVRTAVGI